MLLKLLSTRLPWTNTGLTTSISVFLFMSLSLLHGCASRGTALPANGLTMADVYAEAMQPSNAAQARAAVFNRAATHVPQSAASDWTRTAANEVNHLFPQLPNPQIVMYVYPHLATSEDMPVPGYSTAFSLYEKTHYALPGE